MMTVPHTKNGDSGNEPSFEVIGGPGWDVFKGERIVLLQGPHGPFFSRVAQQLRSVAAAQINTFVFNGGDLIFAPKDHTVYAGRMDDWPKHLEEFLVSNAVNHLFLFGDCRPIHSAAIQVAKRLGVSVWVFEEGYIRPNYITLERGGVNGNSSLKITSESLHSWQDAPLKQEKKLQGSFWHVAFYSIIYFTAAIILRFRFPHYQHHRRIAAIDAGLWILSLCRKWQYRLKERNALSDLRCAGGATSYYVAVLQVATDAQVLNHSDFPSIEAFIRLVIQSFSVHAPADAVLLIKHHPLDRGYADYAELVQSCANAGVPPHRIRYIHDQHLPTLLGFATGVVTINSTVGLSALTQGIPVKTLGKAIYDVPGLTSQRNLDEFWVHASQDTPDEKLVGKLVNFLTATCQINTNFYRP
jgi:capsular polysaccharide export protein